MVLKSKSITWTYPNEPLSLIPLFFESCKKTIVVYKTKNPNKIIKVECIVTVLEEEINDSN